MRSKTTIGLLGLAAGLAFVEGDLFDCVAAPGCPRTER
jgi:hypothetical protein